MKNLIIKFKTVTKKNYALILRALLFLFDSILLLLYSIRNLVMNRRLYDDEVIFTTAADSKYFDNVVVMLDSYFKNLTNPIIFYDLGLTDSQYELLSKKFEKLETRKFNFSKYPDFLGKFQDEKLGNYAWKPVIIYDLMIEKRSNVVWMDAGNVITKGINRLKIFLTALDVVVPISSNKVLDWTHKDTIKYMELDNKYLRKKNFASGLIGFNFNSEVAKLISYEWKEYALVEDCIAPKGSSRKNHRQDQSLLTILLYKHLINQNYKTFLQPKSNFSLGVLFHSFKFFQF